MNSDAARWNDRYQTQKYNNNHPPRELLRTASPFFPQAGLVLDAACGIGSNASFLLSQGLNVIGVDISLVALQQAKKQSPSLNLICGDMNAIRFTKNSFNIILNFFYLQRSLWGSFYDWLKPAGLLIIETFTQEMKQVKPEIPEDFLLFPQELSQAFSTWEILYYQEGWSTENSNHPRYVASLIARKPA